MTESRPPAEGRNDLDLPGAETGLPSNKPEGPIGNEQPARDIFEDPEAEPLPSDLIGGSWLVLRRGKKSFAGVEVG